MIGSLYFRDNSLLLVYTIREYSSSTHLGSTLNTNTVLTQPVFVFNSLCNGRGTVVK